MQIFNRAILQSLLITCFAILVFQEPTQAFVLQDVNNESDGDRAVRFFNEGKFDDAIALAKIVDEDLGQFSREEKWHLLILQSLMAQGKYSDAAAFVDKSLEKFENSIRIRLLGHETFNYNDDPDRAAEFLKEIAQLTSRSSWMYREPANFLTIGRFFLKRGADAKEVLDTFYYPIKRKLPREPEVYRAIGELALQKHDYGLAAENYAKVVELLPGDADGLCKLARAFLKSDSEKANELVQKVLALNSNNVEALLILADQQISSENYESAEKFLKQVRSVNPEHPLAWSYMAVLAHLKNQSNQEGQYRERALKHWPANPEVDHLIGRELSEKYRFKEGSKYQRRSLVYDDGFLPAKTQLAHDLLRLGQELEGWQLADEVFDADEYSVVAHNLVTLRDNMSKFRTLQREGFVVRMAEEEAEIYGERVLDLLIRARDQLCSKYDVELELPIFIEIFPRQQDFAIRTFGLPGGAGFLGVCFGRVITMNSPAAQGANLTSWESVLWHEFCHVVTLQKTKNKMPRWLSEGISVYEEGLADPAWGDGMTIKYREMVLGEELTPVSQLSGAFLRPSSSAHLQFAYYESSLVVEFLIDKYGLPAMLKVLNELANGTPINDALRRHAAPVEFLDKSFATFARTRANEFAKGANWDELDDKPEGSVEYWQAWNKEHPDNLLGLMALGGALATSNNWEAAIKPLKRVIQLDSTIKPPYPLLAKCYQETGDTDAAIELLESYSKMEASDVDLFVTLLETTSAKGDWAKTKKYAQKLAGVNPLLTAPHQYLATASEETSDDEGLIQALTVLSKLDPLDAADVHFRLASALYRQKQLKAAKREVIKALEQAPRYRDAHALLLKIVDEMVTLREPASPAGDSLQNKETQ
jgi:tetratricopeptide (TPR) repeat protein